MAEPQDELEFERWMDSDMSQLNEYEPYDWGNTEKLPGKPIVYVENVNRPKNRLIRS